MKTKNLIMIVVVLCSMLFLSACNSENNIEEKTTDNAASVNEAQIGNTQATNDNALVPPALPN